MRIGVLVILALLLTACVEEPARKRVQEDCVAPEMNVNGECCLDSDLDAECDDKAPAAKPQSTAAATAASAAVAEPTQEKEILPAQEITCDYEKQTLSILLRNTGDKSWQLDGDLSWGAPGHIENVLAFFNQYQMNKRGGTYRDGKLLFGPGPKFSSACGTPILSPGQETRCSFTDVPLAAPNYHDGTNELRLQIPDVQPDQKVEFTCPTATAG